MAGWIHDHDGVRYTSSDYGLTWEIDPATPNYWDYCLWRDYHKPQGGAYHLPAAIKLMERLKRESKNRQGET